MATADVRDRGSATRALVRRSAICFVAMLGFAAALTVLWLSMRAVMEIGGSCASGNTPYVARPCPEGVPGLMVGSIFLGLVCLGGYALSAVGPNLTLLAWPALFLSLGWNFLDYGVNPPDGASSPAWGWLVCGVVFVLMGGLPLILGITAVIRGRTTRTARVHTSIVSRSAGPSIDGLDDRRVWRMGLALQLVAIGFGIWVGIQVFEWGSDTTVRIHFG